MKKLDLDSGVSQTDFAKLVGVSQKTISKRVSDGSLSAGGTCAEWLIDYCEGLRLGAAGRSHENEFDTKHWAAEEKKQSALLKEQDRLHKADVLVLVTEVSVVLEEFAGWFNKSAMSIGAHQLEQLQSRYDIKIEEGIIYKPIRNFLADSCDSSSKLIESICGISS